MRFCMIPSDKSFPVFWRPLGLLKLPWQGPQCLSRVRGWCWETTTPRAACVSPTTTQNTYCPKEPPSSLYGPTHHWRDTRYRSLDVLHSTNIPHASIVCWALEEGSKDTTRLHIKKKKKKKKECQKTKPHRVQ